MAGRAALILVPLAFCSCDCLRQVTAVVVDSRSNIPLADVEVRERYENGTYDEHKDLTDAAGQFSFSDVSGGFRKCPDVQLHFAAKGYVPVDLTFPASSVGDTIRLVPE